MIRISLKRGQREDRPPNQLVDDFDIVLYVTHIHRMFRV